MIKTCKNLVDGILDDACEYQINALDEEEMKAFLKAHLKESHGEEFDNLPGDDVAKIDDKIAELYS